MVTGAGGFVGPHLVRALAAAGARVTGAGLGRPPAEVPIERWTEIDFAGEASIEDLLAADRPDAIVHLAGQSSAALSFQDPEGTFRANVGGTTRLLEAVRASAPRTRVLAVSTSEIYGPCAPGSRAAESAPVRPVSPYGASKAAADAVAGAFASEHGLDVVRVRPFGHSGPGQAPRFVIPAWAQQLAAIEAEGLEPVLRVGNLAVTRDISDVRDVAVGYCALLERASAGGAYNLCSGRGVLLSDVVLSMAQLADVPVRVEVDPARLRPADLPYLVGDPRHTLGACGWACSIPLDRTLRDVVDEWRVRVRSGGA